jgi:precorrin-6B methylase 2
VRLAVYETVRQMSHKQKLLSFVPRPIKKTFAWSFARKIKQEGFASLPVRALLHRGKVLRGPFSGMRLSASFGSVLDAKIIGTYELELQEAITHFIQRKPQIAYVIGAAEGYYAVGLARACPSVSVYAWEADSGARSLLERTASENGVAKNVSIRGSCTPRELLECAAGAYPDLIICDIEGAEIELFTDEVIAALNKSSFIIETHRGLENKVFVERFSKSFDVNLIYSTGRGNSAWPLPRWIPCAEKFKYRIMDEERILSGTRETPWIVASLREYRK